MPVPCRLPVCLRPSTATVPVTPLVHGRPLALQGTTASASGSLMLTLNSLTLALPAAGSALTSTASTVPVPLPVALLVPHCTQLEAATGSRWFESECDILNFKDGLRRVRIELEYRTSS